MAGYGPASPGGLEASRAIDGPLNAQQAGRFATDDMLNHGMFRARFPLANRWNSLPSLEGQTPQKQPLSSTPPKTSRRFS